MVKQKTVKILILLLFSLLILLFISNVTKDADSGNLFAAVNKGDLVAVERLVNSGADVNQKTEMQETPLHRAAAGGFIPTGPNSFFFRVYGGRMVDFAVCAEIAEVLVTHGAEINAKSITGDTPLHLATMVGNFEVSKILITNGANTNARNNLGFTPLHKAVYTERKQIVELLLKNGADLNLKDNEGYTALDYARNLRNDEIAELLQKYRNTPMSF